MNYIITEQQFINLALKNLPYLQFKNQDNEVFIKILKGIGAPVTPETLAFMYAWRECENSLGAESKNYCNNPFNTTWDVDSENVKFCSPESNMYCRKNRSGVKSYKSINVGINATINTIKSGKYPNLLNSLVNSTRTNSNCLQIANNLNGDLDLWGTQDLNVINKCKSYLKGSTPKPQPIVRQGDCG